MVTQIHVGIAGPVQTGPATQEEGRDGQTDRWTEGGRDRGREGRRDGGTEGGRI